MIDAATAVISLRQMRSLSANLVDRMIAKIRITMKSLMVQEESRAGEKLWD